MVYNFISELKIALMRLQHKITLFLVDVLTILVYRKFGKRKIFLFIGRNFFNK